MAPYLRTLSVEFGCGNVSCFSCKCQKSKPNETEVQVLNEDDQQLLAGTKSLKD